MKNEIQLLNGRFNKMEAIAILAEMVAVKINFHETKIRETDNEEDIKMRENRIKIIQKEFNALRQKLLNGEDLVEVNSSVFVN